MSGFLEFWPASRKMVPGLFVCLFDFVFIFYFNGDNKGLEEVVLGMSTNLEFCLGCMTMKHSPDVIRQYGSLEIHI